MTRLPLTVLVLLTGVASAESDQDRLMREREAARIQRQFEELAKKLPKVDPEPGRDKAAVRAPPWCDVVKDVQGQPTPSTLLRTITAPGALRDRLLSAAQLTCSWPNEPSVQQAVAVIEQSWINMTGLSAAQALETLRARMQKTQFKDEGAKLCEALKVSSEIAGEEKAFMAARRAVFYCSASPLPSELLGFLDASVSETDELVRLAVVEDHSRFAFSEKNDYFAKQLVSYAVDQVDYQALSTPKIMKALAAAPYAGNSYARTHALEALGRARMAIAILDAEVKKKSADPDWKELLVTAPQRGIAEWTKKAAQYKDELARSNEFEDKFWGPSRKALGGCWDTLRTDFAAVIKTLPHGNANELKNALSDPIASLLFERLAACAAANGDHRAIRYVQLAQKLRYARGPRLAAYYATIDAFSKILADRTKFPVTGKDLYLKMSRGLVSEANHLALKGSNPFIGGDEAQTGTVKSVKKVAGGLQVTFVTEKHKEMGSECNDTNRIHYISDNGSAVYYRDCKFTKMITVDTTAGAITVPTEMASGITVGAVVEFDAALGDPPTRVGFPTAVYKDKSKKELVNFYGFGL